MLAILYCLPPQHLPTGRGEGLLPPDPPHPLLTQFRVNWKSSAALYQCVRISDTWFSTKKYWRGNVHIFHDITCNLDITIWSICELCLALFVINYWQAFVRLDYCDPGAYRNLLQIRRTRLSLPVWSIFWSSSAIKICCSRSLVKIHSTSPIVTKPRYSFM